MSLTNSTPNKVIIFDWDDTICPSSFVDQHKVERFNELPLHFQNLFNELGKVAEECLDAASKHGEVIIITNSDEGWVKFSAERFIPSLLPLISKYRIVSARTNYERFYPNQPLCWKAAAFAHEVNEFYCTSNDNDTMMEYDDDSSGINTSCASLVSTDYSSEESDSEKSNEARHRPISYKNGKETRKPSACREVISFGDSMEERTAVKIICGQLAAVPKSVMFITSPTPIELIGQLTMLTSYMNFVCDSANSLDLQITPKQAQKCAETYLAQSKTLSAFVKKTTFPRLFRTGSGSSEVVAAATEAQHHTRVD
uniref:Uncharacterized protein n=1 Tax=Attheya septentrionalis TaxID=420275 RepID=A0A7S2UH45_9STRA|mmetsp:Transcript_24793/g.44902  ORF Transcript_24793/g.44902 Transcript_24793/m.44902 type:complete len:312 (+) Transcript_24793:109-1044(+)|eukprot:CAMPEP_0198294756 /NCGR_PEP_ID=MMETSP1449-20131203/24160_1 /TAXON_ID=420275 /ORGANISM="Attheya septentrionalis, Strain CCMP2084" /LENGTH=311 /DNA_ID=CAMNT_0043994815 /DNA_START=65 /DNA_END=1000 /DNA_ORIENTATION=+